MYKGLYDSFSHWFRGGSVWFYSDPHFADEEMQYLRKNYIGDAEQVKRINSKIGKYDTLVILGDIGDTEFVKQLRGYKVLVMGNHDKGASNYNRKQHALTSPVHCPTCNSPLVFTRDLNDDNAWCYTCRKWIAPFEVIYEDNHLFDEVYEGPVFISEKILLSHEPINFPFGFNIHGHDHSNWDSDNSNSLNVCAELINYTPINLNQIVKSGKLGKIDSIHRITIDNATERSKKRG